MRRSRWNLLPPAPEDLLRNAGLPPLIVQFLYNRGITDAARIRSFLSADGSLAADPFLFPDMHAAVGRLYRALLSGENIAVYGDFDADGITATALLVQGLSSLGARVCPYIPHRHTEGHGLTTSVLEGLRQQGVTLVITVDCGITSYQQISRAQRKKLDIIVTDHHAPPDALPPAVAIIDPKLSPPVPNLVELSGAGVAYKLLQALYRSLGRDDRIEALTDLVAIGTIADMSPLVGENRYLVKEGLKLLNASPRPGLRELVLQAGIAGGSIDADRIAWVIAPCLNAAGRLAHASAGYDLLTTDSPEEARRLARWMLQKNTERQRLTTEILGRARRQAQEKGIAELLMVGDEEYPIGVAGLVASRLSEEFYRPSIVVHTGKKWSSGSCRSIPEFNVIEALNRSSHLLTQHGGHSQAAGFTALTRNLPQLEQQLAQLAASHLAGIELCPHLDIDAQLPLPRLGKGAFQTMQVLQPFGRGNPVPTFLSHDVEMVECRTMGNGDDHLRLKLRQDGTVWNGVGFRLGGYLAEITPRLDIVYNLEVDRWGGEERLRLNILDFLPAGHRDRV